MAENLNKERKGWTDKVMKKKKEKEKENEKRNKDIAKVRNFCHCIHACHSWKKK